MAKIERFEDLESWKAARQLCVLIYQLDGPIKKDWVLQDQLRRAGISIMNNIAEGFGRYSNKETIRFLDFARASANEVKSMLYLLEDIAYVPKEALIHLHSQVDLSRNKTVGLIRYLKDRN